MRIRAATNETIRKKYLFKLHIFKLHIQKSSLIEDYFKEPKPLSPANELEKLKKEFVDNSGSIDKTLASKIETALNMLLPIVKDNKYSSLALQNLNDNMVIRQTFIENLSLLDPTTILTDKDLKVSDIGEGSFMNQEQYCREQSFLTLMLQTVAKKLSSESSNNEADILLNNQIQSVLSHYINTQNNQKTSSLSSLKPRKR